MKISLGLKNNEFEFKVTQQKAPVQLVARRNVPGTTVGGAAND